MKIARIGYANTEPFFHYWNAPQFEMTSGTPKALAEAARKGDVAAGPLPLVECWNLESQFDGLGEWCIAARERCRSVYVLSRVPFSELDHVMIGVTKESATSVVLCETLINQKYGNDIRLRKGLQMTDPAWLVIGDQALQLANSPMSQTWPYITDLATEWWDWKKLPFVFARWVVRKDVGGVERLALDAALKTSLRKGLASLPEIAKDVAPRLKVTPRFLQSYFSEFLYELDGPAKDSILIFRELVKEGSLRATAAR